MLKIIIAGYRHEHIGELLSKCSGSVEIAACCGIAPELKEKITRSYPGVPVFDCNLSTLLEKVDCEIVGLGDAYGRRGADAITALSFGKHVIADKPLCTRMEELEQIRFLAQEKHRSVGLMLPLWCSANAAAARQLVVDGKLGEILGVDFTGHHPLNYGTRPTWYWEKGMHGGTINDIAPHGVDLIEYVTGLKFGTPKAARVWNQAFPEVPHFQNGAQFLTELENGAGIMGDVSYFACRFGLPAYWRFSFWGTKGWMEFNFSTPGVTFAERNSETRQLFPGNAHCDYWQSFLDEISGKKPNYFSTEHVLHVTETVLQLQHFADKSATNKE